MDRIARLAWYSPLSPGYAIERWGADYSVFNRHTGETHLLSILPAEVLQVLTAGPVEFGQVCAHLAQLCDVPRSQDWDSKIRALLDELVRLELAERMLV